YEIKAAALGVATLLVTPYLYIYDFPVLAVPIAFLVRLGLRDGFVRHELAAFAAVTALILVYPFIMVPTGMLATLIVAAVVAPLACQDLPSPGCQPADDALTSPTWARVWRRREDIVIGIDSLIVTLIVGAIAGWLAGQIVRGFGFGLLWNIIIGIVGAFIGVWLLTQLGFLPFSGFIGSIVNATIGAVILLVIVGFIKR